MVRVIFLTDFLVICSVVCSLSGNLQFNTSYLRTMSYSYNTGQSEVRVNPVAPPLDDDKPEKVGLVFC